MHSFVRRSFVKLRRLSLIAIFFFASATVPLVFSVESGLADPTRPSGYSAPTATSENSGEKLRLTLIRLGTEPHAVINGKTVAPGESIAGYRLQSLQTTSAILSGPNGRTVLQLAPTIRKSAATSLKSSSTSSVQNR